jgi:hypothetical protein
MTTRTTTMTMTPMEAILRTGLLSGDVTADLVIGILRADQGYYMSRLFLGFALAFVWEWEGWEGGDYDGELLFDDDSDDDEYDNVDKYDNAGDGKRLRG